MIYRFRGFIILVVALVLGGIIYSLVSTFNSEPLRVANYRSVIDYSLSSPLEYWSPDLSHKFKSSEAKSFVEIYERLYTPEIRSSLRWEYLSDEKNLPYTGETPFKNLFTFGSRKYLNSLAVFPGASPVENYSPEVKLHGILGVSYETNKSLWSPSSLPPVVTDSTRESALKNGGFYLNLSNALPLDRHVPDIREKVCREVQYDVTRLPDASIVITFYNEPLSTLLRTVHSVLNRTPPPLLREIILVDDHSNLDENLPGSPLYEYIKHLPKVKLMRLGERKGLVHARLEGAQVASGEVLVILDSHVEVSGSWLEPQLARIAESRQSVVFPQILGINPEDFTYSHKSGIGCLISFKWSMVEQSSITGVVHDPSPIASPSMAGGLFAVNREYFWFLGGYDKGFSMWGAENVEFGFRIWLCGGKLECTPCSRTYHIYRSKGTGYESPQGSLLVNKLRTARVWTDNHFALAKLFVGYRSNVSIGNLDRMIELKQRLNCRPFQWFLDNIDPDRSISGVDEISHVGEIKPVKHTGNYCLDTMSQNEAGQAFGLFYCHNEGGTQHWVYLSPQKMIIPVSHERLCLSEKLVFELCENRSTRIQWELKEMSPEVYMLKCNASGHCLTASDRKLEMAECDDESHNQQFSFKLKQDLQHEKLDFSEEYRPFTTA